MEEQRAAKEDSVLFPFGLEKNVYQTKKMNRAEQACPHPPFPRPPHPLAPFILQSASSAKPRWETEGTQTSASLPQATAAPGGCAVSWHLQVSSDHVCTAHLGCAYSFFYFQCKHSRVLWMWFKVSPLIGFHLGATSKLSDFGQVSYSF